MASRLTFREKCPDVCWQKQLRDQHMVEGVPPVPHLDVKRARVRAVSRKFAAQIILKYEWLGTMARTSQHYGIFFGPFCAGVCCVGMIHACLPGPYVASKYGLLNHEAAVLARGACVHWAPAGTNSRLVAWTARLMETDTQVKLLVAYADTDAGEVGTIYQACGWAYMGRGTSSCVQLISPSGYVRNQIGLNRYRKKWGCPYTEVLKRFKDAGWQTQRVNAKHRYACVLDKTDKALAARVEAMRQPYPKRRAGSKDSVATADQAGEGGATPTPALQLAGATDA